MKDEVLKLLRCNGFGEITNQNEYITGVKTEHFEMIANEIVKLFSCRNSVCMLISLILVVNCIKIKN